MEDTNRLKLIRSQGNGIQEAHTCSCPNKKKWSRLVSICTYAYKRDADGFLLMFIALGLSKAARFQERFQSVLASIPRANNATGKGRLTQEQLPSSTFLLLVENKWKELSIYICLFFLKQKLGKKPSRDTYKNLIISSLKLWHLTFLHYFFKFSFIYLVLRSPSW